MTLNSRVDHIENESQSQQLVIQAHLEPFHSVAKDAGLEGKFVAISFGEDSLTGKDLGAKIAQFQVGHVTQMTSWIHKYRMTPNRNVYFAPSIMEPNLKRGCKGGEKDVLAVLGLVADFDDSDACNWAKRVPIEPSYVLQTSLGRFQAGFVFKEPLTPFEAKPIARGLRNFCKCDHGTADISHVWRLPGTLNWPNKKKRDGGRPPEPVEVRYVR